MKNISVIFLCLICGVLGLAGGWFAGLEKGKNFQLEKEEKHNDHQAPAISTKALENMGIIIRPIELTNFSKYETVPAIIEELPTTTQPVFAPIDGHVEKIFIQQHELINNQKVLLTLIRDAIPRVNLTVTQNILQTATEEFHDSLAKFRRTIKNLEILEKELTRTQKYSQSETNGKYPIIPQKKIIEIQYEIERTQHEIDAITEELMRHGLSKEQIEKGRLGELPHIDPQIWKKVLEIHGLWPAIANDLYALLPKDVQKFHWTMVTIGELVAAGLVTKDLVLLLKNNPKMRKYFLEIGSLLQQGNTLEKIKHLYELNAFHPIVKIKMIPSQHDWDIDKIQVKVHQSVKEGDHLITLKNYHDLHLIAKPEGSERNFLLQALQNKSTLEAYPLLSDEAPILNDLYIDNIVSDEKTGTMKAYIKVKNVAFNSHKDSLGVIQRTWKLRTKQQYILKIPTETMKQVYIFPKDAIAQDGSSKVVFLQNGDYFKPIEIKILYQDHEVVVVSNDADIFPGDLIVHKGAFALGLALKSDTTADAGHGHAH